MTRLYIAPDALGIPTLWREDPARPSAPMAVTTPRDTGAEVWALVEREYPTPDAPAVPS